MSGYNFDKSFERAVVALLVTDSHVWSRVGVHVDPTKFTSKVAQLLAGVAKNVYEEVGKPPGSASVVLQRVRRLYDGGKVSAKMMHLCSDYLMDAEDAGLPDPEVAINEIAAVLKRINQQQVLDDAFTTFAERGSMETIAAKLRVTESIGKANVSLGVGLDNFAAELDNVGVIDRLPTGFQELDAEMGGGMARGEFGFWLAATKVGKTMALVQNAAIGFMRGLSVFVATLELDTLKWRARFLGTVTGTPYQDILTYGSKSVAFERLADMQSDEDFTFGSLRMNKFGGHQTSLPEVLDWVKREQDRTKKSCDLLVIDYADKLIGESTTEKDYTQMRSVYEGIRLYAESNNCWAWSASQSKRIAMGEMPTINHCADSQHKVRCTDLMVGLTRYPANENMVGAKVLALRNGAGDGAEAGPLPNGFDYGCFVRNCASGVDVAEALANGEDNESDLGVFS